LVSSGIVQIVDFGESRSKAGQKKRLPLIG